MRAVPLALSLAATVFAAPLAGQGGTCSPSGGSREAQVFAHMEVPLAFGMGQAPWIYRPGQVQVGVEGSYIPDASARIRTPTKCRPGASPENWNQASVLVRPRVGFSLANGIMLEVAWVPPVRVQGIKPSLWSFALSRVVPLNRRGALFAGRAHMTIGSVRAPIVCSEAATLDASNTNCFGATESDDKFSPNAFGVELAATFPVARGRVRPYLGGGYNILHPRLQESYRDALDVRHTQKTKVNLSRLAVFGGLTLEPVNGFMLSGEAYSTPSDVVTGRVRVTIGFGGRQRADAYGGR